MSRGILVTGTVRRSTDGAVLVDLEQHGEVWLPRSQITDHSIEHGKNLDEEAVGESVDIEITEWIAEEKGII